MITHACHKTNRAEDALGLGRGIAKDRQAPLSQSHYLCTLILCQRVTYILVPLTRESQPDIAIVLLSSFDLTLATPEYLEWIKYREVSGFHSNTTMAAGQATNPPSTAEYGGGM